MDIIDISRSFDHFPENFECPICGSNKDTTCVLVPIPGTEDGRNVQAEPVHLKCAELFNEMNR
jgi:transcription elongation factor Elf1